jgi:phage terminase small subunit
MAKAKKGAALNPRQLAFVEHYLADPNATKAARKAGYTGSDETLATTGARMLRNAKVAELLAGRQAKASDERMTRAQKIQAFWEATMEDPKTDPQHRLKASELLGKVEGLFVEKTKHEGQLEITIRRGNDAPAALPPKENDNG